MKTVILNSKSGQEDLYTYGKQLLEQLQKEYEVVMYEHVAPDFSNVPELLDDSEKLVLFNQYSVPGGFKTLTNHLPFFKNIKFLLSPYSAYEGLDLTLLQKMNINYRNNGGANSKSVAQYAITVMFMLLSRFPQFTKEMVMPSGCLLGEEFSSKTAGIIGMGNVGQEILSILNGLGIQTVYFNRTEKEVKAKKVTLPGVFDNDIVFISIATNSETIDLLSGMGDLIKEKNYLIDVSATDELYDKKKVAEMLNEGKFKGYGLEIYDPKKLVLSSDKNFIATPHIAWCTKDAEKRTVENYLNRALSILRGDTQKIDFIV